MTKAELQASTDEVCAHIDAVGASLREELRLVADDLAALSEKLDENHREIRGDLARLDQRLMRVEARAATARSRLQAAPSR